MARCTSGIFDGIIALTNKVVNGDANYASLRCRPLPLALQSKGECIAMIAREWKCRVPETHTTRALR